MASENKSGKIRDYAIAMFFIVATVLGSAIFLRLFFPLLFWKCSGAYVD
ncbi:hypothetical protein J4450_00260 [Candidatus Micrarchaeota archaeon]|nr:hypothetical protein [Candidatus Micrarchaeota archaeon]